MYLKRKLGLLKYFLFLPFMASVGLRAQTTEISKNKIEFSVKGKEGRSVHAARSVSLSFSNPNKGASFSFTSPGEDPAKEKKYFITLDFETMSRELFKLIKDYNSDFSGELLVIRREDNRVTEKIEFSGASVDNAAFQSTTEDTSMFLYLWCSEISVNGVKLN